MQKTVFIFLSLALFYCSSYANVIKPRPEERISYGNSSTAAWTAAIIRDDGRLCAGALISDQFVLTSAFCVDNEVQIEVVLGAYNLSNPNENNLRFFSREVIIHDGWNPKTLKNDIALVKLPSPIPTTDKITPIKLPTVYDDRWENYQLAISGWGETENENQTVSVMRKAMVDGRDPSVCATLYPKYFLAHDHFCFGGTTNGTMCAGDEGGPAYYNYGISETMLVGIASFRMAQTCHTQKGRTYPGVYTAVYWHLDWIERYVNL